MLIDQAAILWGRSQLIARELEEALSDQAQGIVDLLAQILAYALGRLAAGRQQMIQ